MIRRLREPMTAEQLAETYATPHDHRRWAGHRLRVATTVAVAHAHLGWVGSVADLSCGDGAIAEQLCPHRPQRTLGDIAPGYAITGPIEETIGGIAPVDVFVCAETLEHLDAPGPLLERIRAVASKLVLSTPIGCWDDRNPEHYWAWDREGVEGLLGAAGWTAEVFALLDTVPMGDPYVYGIWVAS